MQALEEAFPDTPLLPQDPDAAAAVKQFCTWCVYLCTHASTRAAELKVVFVYCAAHAA